MPLRTALFDLDGTLIDHFRAIHRCHSFTMRQLGLPEPTLGQVRAAVGGGVELAVERLVGKDLKDRALAIYRPHWDAIMLEDVDLLAGARELLAGLRAAGVTCGVLTNKHGPSSRKVCTHLGLDPYLSIVVGATDTPWYKPDPAFSRHVLERLGAEAASTVLVGDSPWDVEAAARAGMGFCGVATGTHSAEELRAAGAERVFADLNGVAGELLGR